MESDRIFSWAENEDGVMVHVDSVLRGEDCGCTCPRCHEKLKACQGPHTELRSHGFTHISKKRGANLKICYMVSLYKLAEQIIQQHKRIHAPSYFGIFKEEDILFKEVKGDSQYEREDKQPDIIATTEDGKQYLIEFVFKYKVQHKQPIDYKNLSCLEIKLSKQNFDTLEAFLLSSSEDRNWLNNENYFNRIEETYQKAKKTVRVVPEKECQQCTIKNTCAAVRHKDGRILYIENNGERFRLCKTEPYQKLLELKEQEELRRKEELKRQEERIRNERLQYADKPENEEVEREYHPNQRFIKRESTLPPSERTCFNCQNNLDYCCTNENNEAYCAIYMTAGLKKQKINPEYAQECRFFNEKI